MCTDVGHSRITRLTGYTPPPHTGLNILHQDDALLVGVEDLWAYVSMRPDGPYNGLGCVLSDMPPHTRPGHCAAALNGTVLPDGVRCSLGEAASCCIATIDRDTGQQLGS